MGYLKPRAVGADERPFLSSSSRWAINLAIFAVALKIAGIDPFKPWGRKKKR